MTAITNPNPKIENTIHINHSTGDTLRKAQTNSDIPAVSVDYNRAVRLAAPLSKSLRHSVLENRVTNTFNQNNQYDEALLLSGGLLLCLSGVGTVVCATGLLTTLLLSASGCGRVQDPNDLTTDGGTNNGDSVVPSNNGDDNVCAESPGMRVYSDGSGAYESRPVMAALDATGKHAAILEFHNERTYTLEFHNLLTGLRVVTPQDSVTVVHDMGIAAPEAISADGEHAVLFLLGENRNQHSVPLVNIPEGRVENMETDGEYPNPIMGSDGKCVASLNRDATRLAVYQIETGTEEIYTAPDLAFYDESGIALNADCSRVFAITNEEGGEVYLTVNGNRLDIPELDEQVPVKQRRIFMGDVSPDGNALAVSVQNLAAGGRAVFQAYHFQGDALENRLRMVSQSPAGERGDGHSWVAGLANNGDTVLLTSKATNLVNGIDDNQPITTRLYRYDFSSGAMQMISGKEAMLFSGADQGEIEIADNVDPAVSYRPAISENGEAISWIVRRPSPAGNNLSLIIQHSAFSAVCNQ